MTLRLRPAEAADETFLFTLRTDPEVARQSSASPPTRAEHALWFAERPRTRALYIVEAHTVIGPRPRDTTVRGVRVGMARLELLPATKTAWVSLALCADARGRGFGRKILRLLEAEAPALGIRTLNAWVKPQNTASVRTFDAEGYDFVGQGILCLASKVVA